MGIFDRFPYSSTHEMNLDFMLGKATEIAESLQEVQDGLSDIDTHKAQAEQAAQAAQASQAAASASAGQAAQHKTDAEDAADRAEAASTEAETAADRAEKALGNMTDSETVCLNAAEEAQQYAQASQSHSNQAMLYKNDAETAKNNAAVSASQAATSAGSAANSATDAASSANSANVSATNASLQASNAATSAANAATSETNAATSATNAAASANGIQEAANHVESLVESLPEDFTDLNNTVNQLSDETSNLKSAIGALGTSVDGTKNYIEGKKLITAIGATRGDVTDDANFSVSELIPMSAMPSSGNTIKVDYGTISENTMFALYNSQGVYIDSWELSSSDTNRAFTFSYTSYTDLTYVRFAFKKGYSAKITSQHGEVTYWTIQSVGGLLNDVDALESTVSGLSSTFMQTNTYIDFSMVNRLDPSECEVNTIVTPSTGSVDAYSGYFTTDYIPIGTNETLHFYRFDTKEIKSIRMFAAYDADKNVIPDHGSTSEVTSITQSDNMAYIKASLAYLASDYARTPEDTAALTNANPVYIPGYGNSPIIKTQYLERHTMWVRSTDTEAQIIQKFVDAFNMGNVDVYFERATYQFGTELSKVNTDYGMIHNEIPIGNGCRYYFNGSTLIATIDLTQHPAVGDDEFYCNFFGCQRRPSSFEMHDGVLIATDTRYVVHDESSALTGSFKHLYQNMEMHYNTNARQETIRKCIGGGTGESGVVEIVGCKFSTDASDSCVSYHGNGTDVIGAEFDLNVRDCWFSNSIRAGELSEHQTGRFYYTGNSAASAPATYVGWTVTSFLNETRT